jgi:hypothetical protein
MLGLKKEFTQLPQKPTTERLSALKRIIPRSLLMQSLKETGSDRYCRRLPKWFLLWLVVGMGLYATDCYRQIFRWLQRFRKMCIPGRTTLCEARQRLGVAPVRWLFNKVVKLLASPKTLGAFYRGMRLMALDGFVLNIPDTPDNARIFGRPKNGRTEGAFPQVRVLALCEVGTHVLWKCLFKPIRCAEICMAKHLLRFLAPDMLLLWDRGFLSYENVQAVLAGEAHLLARIKKNLVFAKLKVFRDGSYLAKMYRSAKDRRNDREGILVRIIEYTIQDKGRKGSGEVHRLLTTLLDASVDPAKRLIELYHERWEEELTIDELKTHQGERPVLRSQTPAGVVQEVYGWLLAHFVVRTLMFEAATKQNLPPRQMSFTGALKILRCRLPECPRNEKGRKRWYKNLLAEIAEETLEERRDRVNPRVIKCKMSKWNKKRPEHKHYPQPQKTFGEAVEVVY